MTTTASNFTAVAHDPGSPGTSAESRLMSRRDWVWLVLLAAGFIAFHYNFIWRMVRIATDQWGGDWSHALVIPFIGIYYLFQKRDDLMASPRRVFWPGLPLLFAGMFSYIWWITPGRNDMLQGYSMIIALFGLVLFLLGPAMMRVLWFPILFLGFAVKVSDRLWEAIAWQLQKVAAHSATILLNVLGVDASVQGSTIDLYKNGVKLPPLNVAEACSGLRMLMAFMALGVAMAFLFDRAWWQRLIMVLLTVPIAIAVNVGRVTILGVLNIYQPNLAEGDFHKFVGLLMLIPALLMFMGLGWVLDQIMIEDENAPTPPPPPPSAGGAIGGSRTREPINPRWVAEGVASGAALTVLVGINYLLLWAVLAPGVYGAWLGGATAAGALAVGVVVLLVGAWVVLRRNRPRGDASPARLGTTAVAIGAGVLFAGVLGLGGVLEANGVVLHKESLKLREQFFNMPAKMGAWTEVYTDKPLSAEIVETLGTTLYLGRVYKRDASPGQTPAAVRLHVAYYTGTPDTVPHVPDRCMVAGGATPIGLGLTPMSLRGPQYRQTQEGAVARSRLTRRDVHIPATDFNATMFSFANPRDPDRTSSVVYFFSANGRYLATPDEVRLHGFDPRDRYAYYCKVEVMPLDVSDPAEAKAVVSSFLSDAMPEIMACLPDWVDVKNGAYPKPSQTPRKAP